MTDIYGDLRSLSSAWVASSRPIVGSHASDLIHNAFPNCKFEGNTLSLGEGELERVMSTLPASLFSKIGVTLFSQNGEAGSPLRSYEHIEQCLDKVPAWVAWSASHNANVNMLVIWARDFLRDLKKDSKAKWAPVKEMWCLRFNRHYYTDIVKDCPAPMFQRPLSMYTSHYIISETFLDRHVQDTWAQDYLDYMKALDDAFEVMNGDYRKKMRVIKFAETIISVTDIYTEKLFGNKSRPLPLHTELNTKPLVPEFK